MLRRLALALLLALVPRAADALGVAIVSNQTNSARQSTTSTSWSLSFGHGAPTVGDVVFVFTFSGNTNVPTISGWTNIASQNMVVSSNGGNYNVFERVVQSGDPQNFTLSVSPARQGCWVAMEFQNQGVVPYIVSPTTFVQNNTSTAVATLGIPAHNGVAVEFYTDWANSNFPTGFTDFPDTSTTQDASLLAISGDQFGCTVYHTIVDPFTAPGQVFQNNGVFSMTSGTLGRLGNVTVWVEPVITATTTSQRSIWDFSLGGGK